MPSPFPGMNPYLEQSDTWEDFHHSFVTYLQEALSAKVGPNHYVKVAVRPSLHELAVDVERYSSLEICDCRNRRLVTAVELLSHSNKTLGADRDEYLRKRSQVLRQQIHLVEIDLRRGGERPRPPNLPACDYYVLVARAQDRPRIAMWPIPLRDRLPVIPIPLMPPDPDVPLDLKAVLDRTYDAAAYGKYIYGETPEPPLTPEDDAWARQFVPQPERNNGNPGQGEG
jgi:hypothetical protein